MDRQRLHSNLAVSRHPLTTPPLSRLVLKNTISPQPKNFNLAYNFCCHFRHSRPAEFLKAYSDLPLQGGFTGIFGYFLALS
jgi:hypothetical protein